MTQEWTLKSTQQACSERKGYETTGQAGAGLAKDRTQVFSLVVKLNEAVIHFIVV